jgi:hypothetical protein
VSSQRDICTGEDGCIFAVKEYIYLPINDKSGKRDSFAESFDMKIMLAYSDRLIFFEANQTPIFQRELPPGKWLRTIFYNEITLDCGEDGNKICFAGELERKAPKFKIIPQVLNGIKDADKMCLAAPVIDNTERPPETSALYICSNNQALMRDFFRMRDKISRWADTYQMRIVEEEHSALNGVLRKAGSFKYYSDDGKELLISLQLYFQKIRAYIDPNNFLTKVFEFGLKQIKEREGVQTVEEALELKILTKAVWEQFKSTHSVSGTDKCCLNFPLKKGGVLKQERNLFVCSAVEKDCEKEALNWAVTLNTYVRPLKY